MSKDQSALLAIARYEWRAAFHFARAAEMVGTPAYQDHVDAALAASIAASKEMLDPDPLTSDEEMAVDRRLKRYPSGPL